MFASHGFFVQGMHTPPCKHSLKPDIAELQVITIFLAVYKHFIEAIDAIDNGMAQPSAMCERILTL